MSRGASVVRFRRLRPEGEAVTAAEATEDLLDPPAPPDARPWVALNMVSTLDGRVTLGGRAGPIGNEADRVLFHELRARAGAVLVGAGTARVEHYGRIVRDPARRAEREHAGMPPDALACIVTRSLALPVDEVPLLADPESSVVIMTTSVGGELEGVGARVEYMRSAGPDPDLLAMLRDLRARHGVRFLLCEGGPTLNSALLHRGLVDELFVSIAPKLVGGPDPLTLVAGPTLADAAELELRWLLEADHNLFARYAVRRDQ